VWGGGGGDQPFNFPTTIGEEKKKVRKREEKIYAEKKDRKNTFLSYFSLHLLPTNWVLEKGEEPPTTREGR